jgi:murein L,D-transpeptidase YafK
MSKLRWQFVLLSVLAVALTARADTPLPKDAHADHVIIYKAKRELELVGRGQAAQDLQSRAGARLRSGPKDASGDGEDSRGTLPDRLAQFKYSKYHLALHVSYPRRGRIARARSKLGVDPGGAIMIHGLPKEWAWIGAGHRSTDWTLGCIAVTNPEIEEIWRAVKDGTPVEIKP